MARKASRKAAPARAEKTQVRVAVDVPSDVATYYANHVEVSRTSHDFSITVARIPSQLQKDVKEAAIRSGVLHIEPLLQLVVPPTLIPGLIKALTIQQKNYEAEQGPIWVDPASPREVPA
jgi:hypothetical protein